MTPAEHLKKAKALLSKKDRWCKHSWAQDKEGRDTLPDEDKAYSFCAMGALQKVQQSGLCAPFHCLAEAAPCKASELGAHNDSLKSHAALLRWFDKAIAIAEEAQDDRA